MTDTKTAFILRDDLASWQSLNVTAFLATGLAGQAPDLLGEVYRDRDGKVYNRLWSRPMIVLSADAQTLGAIHRRVLEHGLPCSLYVEEMFATGNDADNRAVFARSGVGDARIAGIGLHAERKLVDKVTRGARLHR
jgi:hypothetical protein